MRKRPQVQGVLPKEVIPVATVAIKLRKLCELLEKIPPSIGTEAPWKAAYVFACEFRDDMAFLLSNNAPGVNTASISLDRSSLTNGRRQREHGSPLHTGQRSDAGQIFKLGSSANRREQKAGGVTRSLGVGPGPLSRASVRGARPASVAERPTSEVNGISSSEEDYTTRRGKPYKALNRNLLKKLTLSRL
jgi:hypothetical protein